MWAFYGGVDRPCKGYIGDATGAIRPLWAATDFEDRTAVIGAARVCMR